MKKIVLLYKKKNLITKHFRIFLPYISLLKLTNLMLSYIEFLMRREKLISSPTFIKIETSRICNLKCPTCSHSKEGNELNENVNYSLSLADVKKLIEPFHKTLIFAALTLQGEAFSNNELPLIIEYIHKKGIATSFPTNFCSKITDETFEKIILSGFDSIYISLDGTTKETYSMYRIGGDFDLVLQNVKSLSDTKKRLNKKNPTIVLKFIVFPHNEHEIDYVTNNYSQLGFDSYYLVHDAYGNIDSYIQKRKAYKQEKIRKKKACLYLWTTIIVNWMGIVHPCTNQEHNLGNGLNENLKSIWNNENYRYLRRGFRKKNFEENMDKFCHKCIRI
ncbi:MAG: radical SAM protein [Bacteroidales bacterium]|nr:radical SAM protein [Bacteroidales bacterium]